MQKLKKWWGIEETEKGMGMKKIKNKRWEKLNTTALIKVTVSVSVHQCSKTVANVEAAITQSEEEATKARIGVVSALSRARLPTKNIQPEETKAVKEPAKDDDIVVLPVDKGRATVVDHSDYSAKMVAMLGDEDTYQQDT